MPEDDPRLNDLYILARSFPVLRNYAPIDALDKDRSGLAILAEWARHGDTEHAGMWAAVFVLSVWSQDVSHYSLPQFDLHKAMGYWDDQQRHAFAQWAASPFWC